MGPSLLSSGSVLQAITSSALCGDVITEHDHIISMMMFDQGILVLWLFHVINVVFVIAAAAAAAAAAAFHAAVAFGTLLLYYYY